MTWQESLRQLDARLAKGEIDGAEYRKARDEILAEASSGYQKKGTESPRQDLWRAAKPVDATRDEPNGEITVVVAVDDEADERTQVVTAEQLTAGPLRPGQLPAAYPHRSTPIQGQEVFARAGTRGSGRLLRFLVPLLILAVVGAGVWWFGLRDGGDQPRAAAAETPPATTSQPRPEPPTVEELASTLPELPGRANANSGTMPLAEAQRLKLFSPTYTELLADNGVERIVYLGSAHQKVGYLLAVAPVAGDGDAATAAERTSQHLRRAGFTPAEPVGADHPEVIARTDSAFRTYVSVYAAGDVWVQLNASGAPDGDDAALRAEFQTMLRALTDRLPPS